MNDRELLELAAKAAGIDLAWDGDAPKEITEHWSGNPEEPPHERAWDWNPLTDDGDALRLAAQLSIGLHWCASGRVYAHWDGGEAAESSRENRQANLRRAIVLAAAKIGEGGDKA